MLFYPGYGGVHSLFLVEEFSPETHYEYLIKRLFKRKPSFKSCLPPLPAALSKKFSRF
jgi:hypothetical protein